MYASYIRGVNLDNSIPAARDCSLIRLLETQDVIFPSLQTLRYALTWEGDEADHSSISLFLRVLGPTVRTSISVQRSTHRTLRRILI